MQETYKIRTENFGVERSQSINENNGCDENGGDCLTILFAMPMKYRTMTAREIACRSIEYE